MLFGSGIRAVCRAWIAGYQRGTQGNSPCRAREDRDRTLHLPSWSGFLRLFAPPTDARPGFFNVEITGPGRLIGQVLARTRGSAGGNQIPKPVVSPATRPPAAGPDAWRPVHRLLSCTGSPSTGVSPSLSSSPSRRLPSKPKSMDPNQSDRHCGGTATSPLSGREQAGVPPGEADATIRGQIRGAKLPDLLPDQP